MNNLEKSEKIISAVVGELAPNGVIPIHIEHGAVPFSQYELSDLVAAMNWLVKENVIHVDAVRSGRYRGCTLSSKGYALLGQRLKIDEGEIRLIDAVEKVNSGEAAYSKAGNFVGGLLAAFTKSIGS